MPYRTSDKADTSAVMITTLYFTARQKADPCSCLLLIWLVNSVCFFKKSKAVALNIPVVFSVYSDHATTGTANSPSRPAANCPVFAVLTELVELAEAGSWSVNACKSKDMVFVQSDLCDKDSSYKPRDLLNASDFEAVQARAPQEQ